MESIDHESAHTSQETEGLQYLPSLREPLGWRELPTPELEERLMALMAASVSEVPFTPSAEGALHAFAVKDKPLAASSAETKYSGLSVGLSGLPWLVFLAGIIMVVPVLIWAPLIGGLCFGTLVLQSGLMRQWVRRQREGLLNSDASVQAENFQSLASLKAVEVLPTRVRIHHSGWLLAGVLFLLAVQAAMLIVVLQLKAQESASAWMNRDNSTSKPATKNDALASPPSKPLTKTSEEIDQRK